MRFGAVLLISAALAVPAGAVVIDDYSVGALTLQASDPVTGAEQVQAGLNPDAVLGGTRRVWVGSTKPATHVTIDTNLAQLTFATDANVLGYLKVGYGSETALGIDLTADGADRFVLDVVDVTPELDSGVFNIVVVSGPEASPTTVREPFGAGRLWDLPGSGVVEVPFADFAGADFRQVQSIMIEIARAPEGYSLTLGRFVTTPEPASVFAMLLLGGVLRRSR